MICWAISLTRFSSSFAGSFLTISVDICKYKNQCMPELSHFTAEFFKALSHPLRIRILEGLRRGEVGVNDLSARLNVEQTTLSQQLAVLRKSSIVAGRKEGQNVYYSVRDAAIFRLLDEADRKSTRLNSSHRL